MMAALQVIGSVAGLGAAILGYLFFGLGAVPAVGIYLLTPLCLSALAAVALLTDGGDDDPAMLAPVRA